MVVSSFPVKKAAVGVHQGDFLVSVDIGNGLGIEDLPLLVRHAYHIAPAFVRLLL